MIVKSAFEADIVLVGNASEKQNYDNEMVMQPEEFFDWIQPMD